MEIKTDAHHHDEQKGNYFMVMLLIIKLLWTLENSRWKSKKVSLLFMVTLLLIRTSSRRAS
jgi:hypothetical protein